MFRVGTVVIICVLILCSQLLAGTTYFDVDYGPWWDSSSWTNGVPTSSDIAVVDSCVSEAVSDCAAYYLFIGGSSSGVYGQVRINSSSNLTTGGISVGEFGMGCFLQEGGCHTVEGQLLLGYEEKAYGEYDFQYGTLTTGETFIGIYGEGLILHRGGVHHVTGEYLGIGYASSANGQYYLNGNSTLYCDGNCLVGISGEGIFNHSGGDNIIGKFLYVGYHSGSTGRYELRGTGNLSCNESTIGRYGNGSFVQSGGSHTTNSVTLGLYADSGGTYELNGGTLNVSGNITSGDGDSTLILDGGTLNLGGTTIQVGQLTIGHELGINAAYGIDGAEITADNMTIGNQGTGNFVQMSGTTSIANTLTLGATSSGNGTYEISGGQLTATDLKVGNKGKGELNITNGSTVVVESNTWVSYREDSSGIIHFDNGALTTNSLICSRDDITGTGTVDTHGLVCDVDLIFDATHGLTQMVTLNQNPGQNVVINLNVDGSGLMGVGYGGVGGMSIFDEQAIHSTIGYIGFFSGSKGVVTVDGAGSTWRTDYGIYIGNKGDGTLNITKGSTVSNSAGHIANSSGSLGVVNVDGIGSMWTNNFSLYIGGYGDGVLNISNGGTVINNSSGYIGYSSGSTGLVTVDGAGSTWTTDSSNLIVGLSGNGTLEITDGGMVSNDFGCIGASPGSRSNVKVDGLGSMWTNYGNLYVGRSGEGLLAITNGGLVSVGGTLAINFEGEGHGFINMALGGMLALKGDTDDSLADFLDLIGGTGAIRYWEDSISDWAPIVNATYGEDYTLGYMDDGELAGYTLLTVTAAPEPATIALLALGSLSLLRRRRRS